MNFKIVIPVGLLQTMLHFLLLSRDLCSLGQQIITTIAEKNIPNFSHTQREGPVGQILEF